ncbi:MAG TPA: DNA-binding response regulator [Cytophagales bacterium]|nr:DNA-binding response regulator [Cytophagales bacterium]HAA23947.1 DNA-binding response regulator [Cytophagales bacterium]HAP65039.1 DNA-binding response regulator [Cytophagales bacterium]
MKLKCLIVDDEPIARDLIASYIEKVDRLEVVAMSGDAFQALNILHEQPIDIMFLDIQMPSLTGLDMLKTLDRKPQVILTTAYSEFGAESYEYGVTDYLLKPITFERFMKAVNKILIPQAQGKELVAEAPKAQEHDFIFFKADKKIYKFNFEDLLFFQGSGNYVKVFTKSEKPLMVLEKLSALQEKLPADDFARIHKSYLIQVKQIQHVSGNRVFIEGHEIPIGQVYREELLRRLGEG